VAPFIATLSKSRFSLRDLREKIDREQILTYVITREPAEQYQQEAMQLLSGCRWVEIRYNDSIHAKLYVADALRDADSFALFGSGNLTAKSIESNIELAMLVYSEGHGRDILRDLQYWASVRLRTLNESKLIQPIRGKRS
jgi:phosphatidylserine/phosphatidylglycerophosphate/cardiolipin synthase-like enzyme